MQNTKTSLHKAAGYLDPAYWAITNKLMLQAGPYEINKHEYQHDILREEAIRQCMRKGAQLGVSECQVLKTLHGMVHGKYPTGVLYVFPTNNDVTDFSKGRFNPLIDNNPFIKAHVTNTDAANIKNIGGAMLYLRGARVGKKIEGVKKTSTKLKTVPVDRVVFDESDEIEPTMINLALQRMAHSSIKEEFYLSTPSIPDYGIDKMYNDSDQRVWMIRCEHCSTETCLELEFPNCIKQGHDGKYYRACKKCGSEILPKNGRWVSQYPSRSKDMVGWWVSQLVSMYVDPGEILKAFNNPPDGDPTEVYNSMLGMAYIPAENMLTVADVLMCCGNELMAAQHDGPCAMGVDINKQINVVVGCKISDRLYRVVYITRVENFEDLYDIAKRYNVQCAVIDILPETRKAREYQEDANYPVFLCEYKERPSKEKWGDDGVVRAYRTEICDKTHSNVILPGVLEIPRRNTEVDQFAREVSNLVKVLDEDEETGLKVYRYKKKGQDHYRHALNYFTLACERIPIAKKSVVKKLFRAKEKMVNWAVA